MISFYATLLLHYRILANALERKMLAETLPHHVSMEQGHSLAAVKISPIYL